MNKNYYLIKYKWGPGGKGFVLSVHGKKSKVVVGSHHINKKSDLEIKVEEGELVSVSEDYSIKKIYLERVESMKKREERYKTIWKRK